MGLRLVDIYVPWGVHETAPGDFDFGERDPALDVARFLEIAHELGLRCVLRPGPHINAELTLLRAPRAHRLGRAVPGAHAGRPPGDAADRAGGLPGAELRERRLPRGDRALVPRGRQGARAPSLARRARSSSCRSTTRARSTSATGSTTRTTTRTRCARSASSCGPSTGRASAALRAAWQDETLAFATVEPPKRFDARETRHLARHVDWAEFHEQLLSTAMERMAAALVGRGLRRRADDAQPAARRERDAAQPGAHDGDRPASGSTTTTARRPPSTGRSCGARPSSPAAARGARAPAFGAEVGAGFPPFFAPLDENDSMYALMCAMAYGLRGFNLYMAVERDRWIGAPIDPHGRPRPMADAYARLLAALDARRFTRCAGARRCASSSRARCAGSRARRTRSGRSRPRSSTCAGAGWRETVLERDFGLDAPPVIAAEAYLRAFERALHARGVPFAYAGGETVEHSTAGAQWIVCASAGGLKPDLVDSLRAARATRARSSRWGRALPSSTARCVRSSARST